jgi:SRSO17 transposase
MTGGSVEATLELWAASLRDVKGRIGPLFRQQRMAQSAGLFLDALLGPERRKTGWMRAEAAGDPGPWRQQALLGRAQWDADALRDVVRDYVVETLAVWRGGAGRLRMGLRPPRPNSGLLTTRRAPFTAGIGTSRW